MNLKIIRTLVAKDIALYFRNRFFALVTVLSLLIYISIYYFMPSSTSERFSVAMYPANVPLEIQNELVKRQMEVTAFDDLDLMKNEVKAGTYRVGIAMPENVAEKLEAGVNLTIIAYYPPGIPANLNAAFNDLLTLVFNEISYSATEQPLLITRHEEVLGYDLAGKSIAPRDRLLPLFAVLLFMMETLGLANLLAEEAERGTLRALLVTPMNIEELFVGKSITGIGIGLTQAAVLMLVTGALGINPLLVITTLILGALLVTGVGFLIASVASDMMSVMSWGTLAIILLGLPSVTVMFPGTVSSIVRIIPSYYLIDTLHRIVNFNAGWSDVSQNLSILLITSIAMLLLGTTILRRKLS